MKPDDANFQVYIRIRPLSSQQSSQMSYFETNYLKKNNGATTPTKSSVRLSQNAYNFMSKFYNCDINNIIRVEDNTLYVVDSEYKSIDRKYRPHRFNGIFNEKASNMEIYERAVQAQVSKLLAGYNSTIFTYGITGSGKTYTVFGGCAREQEKGLCYLTYEYLLARKLEMERTSGCQVSLGFSFFEIYNENVRDLLSNEPIMQAKSLSVIEDSKGNTQIQDLTEKQICSVNEIYQLLSQGCSKRALASTNSNLYSSRSHALQQLTVQVRQHGEIKSIGRLFIIDLAGSQKMQTASTPKGIAEGANINKSLLALGNCINILSQKKTGQPQGTQHIPYRDSKLTRILKDSLGGNTSTLMIACISTNPFSIEETLTTLNYASRANGIQRKISKNSVSLSDQKADELSLRRQLDQLRTTLSRPVCCSKCGHQEQTLAALGERLNFDNLQDIGNQIEQLQNRNQALNQTSSGGLITEICEDIVKITAERQQIINHLNTISVGDSLVDKLKEALRINKEQLDEYKEILVRHVSKVTSRQRTLLQTIQHLTQQNRQLLATSQSSRCDQQNQLTKCDSIDKSRQRRRMSNKVQRIRVPSLDSKLVGWLNPGR